MDRWWMELNAPGQAPPLTTPGRHGKRPFVLILPALKGYLKKGSAEAGQLVIPAESRACRWPPSSRFREYTGD